MTKRSENKNNVFLWLSKHIEATKTESLKPLKDAFPEERKQNLSAWRKEFIKIGLNTVEQSKIDNNIIKKPKAVYNIDTQNTILKKEPLKQTKSNSILFKDIQIEPNQPKEIKANCFYTADQAAELLQVDSSMIYRMIKNKSLPFLNLSTTGIRGTFRIMGKWLLELKPE